MNAEKCRMLICEDNEEVANILARFFSGNGCEVSTVINGEQALDLLRNHRFDILITDVVMPIAGGVALLRGIRDAEIALPVIVLSGHIGCLEPERFKELGARRVFGKPADLKAMLGAVQALLPDRGTARKKVLVVEDDAALAAVVATMLSKDFDVTVATDGWQALCGQETPYDLLILDMGLPGLDGAKTFAGLNCHMQGGEVREGNAPPTVVMTGHPPGHEGVSQLLEQPAVIGYLRKPFTADELRDAVSPVLT